MANPPAPKPIRLTITVSPEVHETFSRMAEASSLPIGRCMGEWLADTLEGVEFVTAQLVKAREAPRQVIRDMRQATLGLVDELDQLQSDIRSGKLKVPPTTGAGMPHGAPRAASAAEAPRSVIRGGKSPGETRRKGETGSRSTPRGKR